MDIDTLVKLTSRTWSLKILALLHAGVPGRQAPLLAATNASRTSFATSLKHLVELKLLERNPGHGHPLRPEFRLTQQGARIAEIADKLVRLVPDEREFVLLQRSWTVPVLAVTRAPRHFTEIRTDLTSITDRALSQSLHRLEERAWIQRDVDISRRPLRSTYQAANAGIEISRAIGSIA